MLLSARRTTEAAPADPKATVLAFVVYFVAIAAIFGFAAVWIGDSLISAGPLIF